MVEKMNVVRNRQISSQNLIYNLIAILKSNPDKLKYSQISEEKQSFLRLKIQICKNRLTLKKDRFLRGIANLTGSVI